MSILDKVKNMLGGSAKTEELVKKGIDKAERLARKKDHGKHAEQIGNAARKAREMAEKIDTRHGASPPSGQSGQAPATDRPQTPPPSGGA